MQPPHLLSAQPERADSRKNARVSAADGRRPIGAGGYCSHGLRGTELALNPFMFGPVLAAEGSTYLGLRAFEA
jgi:hypothetical protein